MSSSPQTQDRTYLPFRGVENDDRAFLPLNSDLREIRCVLLLPGSGDDPIECQLVYTNVNQTSDDDIHVPYIALSYCWGDITDTVEIMLHGTPTDVSELRQESTSTPFRVTRNLHIALTALRTRETQCLWIDALCINQQDAQEKTHQVQLMGKIYSSAKSVLVWLGPHDVQSRFFVRAWTRHMRPFHDSYVQRFQSGPGNMKRERPPKTLDSLWVDMAQDEELHQLGLSLPGEWGPGFSPDKYKKAIDASVDSLFGRPWWSRIWVIQEVLLAPKREGGGRKVEFRIGNSNLHLQEIRQLDLSLNLLAVVRHDFRSTPRDPSNINIRHVWSHFFTWDQKSLNMKMHDLLAFTSGFDASDHRDRLFALLLLASDTRESFWQEPLISPDYDKTMLDVYEGLVCWDPRCANIGIPNDLLERERQSKLQVQLSIVVDRDDIEALESFAINHCQLYMDTLQDEHRRMDERPYCRSKLYDLLDRNNLPGGEYSQFCYESRNFFYGRTEEYSWHSLLKPPSKE